MTAVHARCEQGRPCLEVTAHLVTVDQARQLDIPSDHPVLEALRETAQRYAEIRNYGQGGRPS
jgi:hypothetical protein